MASTRRLTFATVKSDGSGTTGGTGRPAYAIEKRATQIHRVLAPQVQDSAAAATGTEVELARRRKAVSVKVELRCNCSRESAQVERAHNVRTFNLCAAHASY